MNNGEEIKMTTEAGYPERSIDEIKSYILNHDCLYTKKGTINSNIHKMLSESDKKVLSEHYPNISLGDIIKCVVSNMETTPSCIQCGSYVKSVLFEFCSIQCSRKNNKSIDKRRETNISKYGVTGYNNREKYQQTCLEKYGVPAHIYSEEIKKKISETLLSKSDEEKADIKERRFTTFIEKYGMHPNLTYEINEKRKQSILKKYGVEFTTQLDSMKEKAKLTILEKYGVDHFSKTEEFKNIMNLMNSSRRKEMQIMFLSKISELNTSDMTREEIARAISMNYTTSNKLLRLHDIDVKHTPVKTTSKHEYEIVDFLHSIGIDNIQIGNRTILDGKEIDIFLPDYNLGIEMNGVYWHSEQYGKDKHYHLSKTILSESKGIQLMHIYDIEWTDTIKNDIWKSILMSKLGMTSKIYARNCTVSSVSNAEATEFLKLNHLQGFAGGETKLGLYHNSELVQVMIIGKSRYNKKIGHELVRLSSKKYLTIVGGVSKLLKNINYPLISYADRRYSMGSSYKKIGFVELQPSPPGYYYWDNGTLESRVKYQKHKLESKLPIYDPSLTEKENMILNGYYRIWDCGNRVFIKNIPDIEKGFQK